MSRDATTAFARTLVDEWARHGVRDDFRIRARIGCADDDGRRHDFRILRDRQVRQRDKAANQDQGRQHAGEYRA